MRNVSRLFNPFALRQIISWAALILCHPWNTRNCRARCNLNVRPAVRKHFPGWPLPMERARSDRGPKPCPEGLEEHGVPFKPGVCQTVTVDRKPWPRNHQGDASVRKVE